MAYKNKEQQRAAQAKWLQARRSAFFAGKACVKCGSTERLELDHILREGKTTHKIWSFSLTKREAELAKCQVLCYVCYKEKTKAEWTAKRKCGTRTMYAWGCRCEACRAAEAQAKQLRRTKQAALAQPEEAENLKFSK